jgi:hypothetical protein
MENAVQQAIRLLGPTLFEAAVKTGIQPTTLWKWARAGRVKDGLKAHALAKATNFAVSLEDLLGIPRPEAPNGGRRRRRGPSSATYLHSPASDPPDQANPALDPVTATAA